MNEEPVHSAFEPTSFPAVLLSTKEIDGEDWQEAIQDLKLCNEKETVVTIVTGTHGDIKGDSAFSVKGKLDPELKNEDALIKRKLKSNYRHKMDTFFMNFGHIPKKTLIS